MKVFTSPVTGMALIALAFAVSPVSAQSGVTERVSGNISGVQANNQSDIPAINADGRFVAFTSLASDLVPGDTNGASDVFVHDRRTRTTERVSVDSRGRQGDDHSGLIGVSRGNPAISADGRFVAFHSFATNLVPHDTNGSFIADVFVHDRLTGTTERVSVSTTGQEADGSSHGPAISADGRFVAFQSDAFNLVPKQNNFQFIDQIFVHDRLTGTTEIVSVNNAGQEGNSSSFIADISADGRFVVFSSFADNLVPGSQFFVQVFIHDRATATTERVSVDASGNEGDGDSVLAVVSADGRFVAFESSAANLVPSTDHERHIYVRDRLTGTTERASVDRAGNAADLISGEPDMTPDGRFVTFYSLATNLVARDTNNVRDIFVRDRQRRTTARVSVSTAGEQGNSESMLPKISDDSLVVAFESNADNFVPDDTATGDIYVHDRRTAADLRLAKSDSPDPVAARTELTYTVTVSNNGPGTATEVLLTDSLPAEALFVSASATPGSCTRSGKGNGGGVLTCDLGTLAARASTSVTIVVAPPKAGTLTNTATVTAREPDPNRADNSATATTVVF